jgi:hypothetical protein
LLEAIKGICHTDGASKILLNYVSSFCIAGGCVAVAGVAIVVGLIKRTAPHIACCSSLLTLAISLMSAAEGRLSS